MEQSVKEPAALAEPTVAVTAGNNLTKHQPLDWKFIKDKFAKDCSDPEFSLLCEKAKALGANPLKADCYFIWNWNSKERIKNWSIWLSIDFMRKRALSSGEHQATQRMFDPEKKTATIKVFKKGCIEPFIETVFFNEFYPADIGRRYLWDKMPSQMLKKCAEASCLRMAWPELFEHAYIPEEMDQAAGFNHGEHDSPELGAKKTNGVATTPMSQLKPNESEKRKMIESIRGLTKQATTVEELNSQYLRFANIIKEYGIEKEAISIFTIAKTQFTEGVK